ncbi:hypothetical protein EJB05_30200, partial [Eragrostis curvula]
LIKKAGHPLNLIISEEKRPVGENNELLSREIGFLTRYHAPIRRDGWQSLDENDKVPLYELLKLKFNLDFAEPRVKGCVDLLFSSCYKSFRHRCHNHYLFHGGGETARANPYRPLAERVDDWIWLCDHFETDEYKGCGEITLYKECYSNQHGWASADAMEKHEQMVAMQQQAVEDGETPLNEAEICESVLGKAYGYIRGRGHGPKPNRRPISSTSSSAQQRRMEDELAATKLVITAQQATIESQQATIEAQQARFSHQDKRIDWLSSVMCKIAGVTPPMDYFDAAGPGSKETPTNSSDGQGP